jgi:Trk K+ transport system NAD-binding subunit
MQVVASTYRDHVILCGLGHLGYRVLEQLVASNAPTVVLEKSKGNPFLAAAKAMRVPILIRDMKDDAALVEAGVEHATAIIICTNDEMLNLEVALDARRMNPDIRAVMRMFDQKLASKISGALTIDAAFSSSALAAPVVAAMAFQTRVLSTLFIGGEPHVIAEVTIEEGSSLSGRTVGEIEAQFSARILAQTPDGGPAHSPPKAGATLTPGDLLVVHTSAQKLSTLSAAGRRERR